MTENLENNIFASSNLQNSMLSVLLYKIEGSLTIEKEEELAQRFSFERRIPSSIYRRNDEVFLAVATDQEPVTTIEDPVEKVFLHLESRNFTLDPSRKNDCETAEKIAYRSIESQLFKTLKGRFWIKNRRARIYCETTPEIVDASQNIQLFSCVRVSAEYLQESGLSIVLDSTSTMLEVGTLLEHFMNDGKEDFSKEFDHKYVLFTDQNGDKKTRYFVGIKENYTVSSMKIPAFRTTGPEITLQTKFKGKNPITGLTLEPNEPVAEIKYFENHNDHEYVPLSCLQRSIVFGDLDEIENSNEFLDEVFVAPTVKEERIRQYAKEFRGTVIGNYRQPVTLSLDFNIDLRSGIYELPALRFRDKTVSLREGTPIDDWKFFKTNSLKKFGFYKEPEMDEIIITHRRNFPYDKVLELKRILVHEFNKWNLSYSDDEVRILSTLQKPEDLRSILRQNDEEITQGYITIVDPINFPYKHTKEILNEYSRPSQAIREDTLRYLKKEDRKLNGIADNVIAGITTKCKGIPWILGEPLTSSFYIGLDSGGPTNKKSWATVHVFDDRGEWIHYKEPKFYAKEGIPTDEFKKMIIDSATFRLSRNKNREDKLNGLIIHRDGFLTLSEKKGLESAIIQLQLEDKLQPDFRCAAINVKKSANFRIFSRIHNEVVNPKIGSYYVIDGSRGFLVTTGRPSLTQSTAKPLYIEVINIKGQLKIEDAMKDIFYLSELNWGSPMTPVKLPLTIYYADKMIDFADYTYRPAYIPL